MGLDRENLKNGIKSAFQSRMPSPTTEQVAAFDELAEAITDAVVDAIVGAIDDADVTHVLTSPAGAVTGYIQLHTVVE